MNKSADNVETLLKGLNIPYHRTDRGDYIMIYLYGIKFFLNRRISIEDDGAMVFIITEEGDRRTYMEMDSLEMLKDAILDSDAGKIYDYPS